MKKEIDQREAEFRKLLKRMAAKDPSLINDDSFDEIIRREQAEKHGDRIYYIVLCWDAWVPEAGIIMNDEEEALVENKLMEISSALGRFGLAVLDKKKDPFSRLEEADRIAIAIKDKIETKKKEAEGAAQTTAG